MPTKRNKAGNMQNYVPAGNGEPSGEYGDNVSGSNRNFQSFAKPQATQTSTKTSVVTPKAVEPPKAPAIDSNVHAENRKSIIDFINTNKNAGFSKGLVKEIDSQLEKGDPTCVDILKKSISSVYERKNFEYGITENSQLVTYSTRDGVVTKFRINLNKEVLKEQTEFDVYETGGVFFHEHGHLIDSNGDVGKDLSVTRKLSSGKTLSETVIEESKDLFGSMSYEEAKKRFKTDVVSQWAQEESNGLKAKGVNIDKFLELAKTRLDYDEQINETIEKGKKKYGEDYGNSLEMETLKKFATNKLNARGSVDGIENFDKLYEEHGNNMSKANMKWHRDYGLLSELYGAHAKVGLGLGMGHRADYYRDKDNASREFFAEAFSAKSLNSSQVEVLKKHFPKSYAAFEELLGTIKEK